MLQLIFCLVSFHYAYVMYNFSPIVACPDGQVWTNYSLCQRTCATRDKNIDEECSKIEPGCVCPMGLYMEANKCVNITECQKCVINGTEYQVSLRCIDPVLKKSYSRCINNNYYILLIKRSQ